jgi:hypothetical protein
MCQQSVLVPAKPIGFTFVASDLRGSVGNPGCEDNPYTDAGCQGIRAKPNKVIGIQFYDHSGRKRRKRSFLQIDPPYGFRVAPCGGQNFNKF